MASAGCEQRKATEYVTGVSTQVTVPKYLKAVRININAAGFPAFCQSYKVYDGKVLLPRSLGNFPSSTDGNKRSITFSIVGITEDYKADSANQVFSDCYSSTPIGVNNVRILRRSTQPYVPDHIKFLPMALKYSCFDTQCPDDQTCKGGVCVPDATDPATLEEYTDGMGDGTDGGCFGVPICMGLAIPAVPVNEQTCDFAVAESDDANKIVTLPAAVNPFRPVCTTSDQCSGRPCTNGQCDLLPAGAPPWTGVNVEVTYDGGQTKEILDLDPAEGFTIPDPAKPQTFRLAPGLCEMFKGSNPLYYRTSGEGTHHRITSIRASGTCAPKKPSQAICLADQLKLMGAKDDGSADDVNAAQCETQLLTPTKSALVLVVDHTQKHGKFFQAEVQDALEAPLQDPAFEKTDIGLLYSDSSSVCGGPAPTIKPALPTGVTEILAKFKSDPPTDGGDPKFEASLQTAYDFLGNLPDDYGRRAVIMLGNRKLNDNTCGPDTLPADLAATQLAKPTRPIATFAARVTNSNDVDAEPNNLGDPPTSMVLISTKGTPLDKGLLTFEPNATKVEDKKRALQAAINYLATCLYDVPLTKDKVKISPPLDSTLSYANPLLGTETKIEHVAACNGDTPGWTLDSSDAANPRVKVCGSACTAYQTVLSNTSSFTILYGQPSLPVPLYASTKACYTK